MTLAELLSALHAFPQDAPLVFTTRDGPIGGGYHVTELKLSDITGIDCGAKITTWQESALQLLDVKGANHMPVAKFTGIAAQSLKTLERLADAPMVVEFAHGNQGKHIYQLGHPLSAEGKVIVPLTGDNALCKPAIAAQTMATTASCCGVQPSGAGCC
ncbi:MAG: DUF6428 family protein [Thalassovita sp.]